MRYEIKTKLTVMRLQVIDSSFQKKKKLKLNKLHTHNSSRMLLKYSIVLLQPALKQNH